MADDLSWNHSRQRVEIDRAANFPASISVGLSLNVDVEASPSETQSIVEKFRILLGFAARAQS